MSRKKIPNGWTDYLPYGDKVEGTRLFPFKTPLKLELQTSIAKSDRFTPACLIANMPNLRAVIDLTDTMTSDRYYRPQDFVNAKIDHLKLRICGGGQVPGMDKIREFSNAVDGFLKKYADDPDALIGVHCTHGLNRTGYFICMYMVNSMGCDPLDAIDRFQRARGYEIDRQNFLEEIMQPGRHTSSPQKPIFERGRKLVRPVGTYSYKNDWLEVPSKKPFRGFTEKEARYRGLRRYNRDRNQKRGVDLYARPQLHGDTISMLEMMNMGEPSRNNFTPGNAMVTPVSGNESVRPPPMEGNPSRFLPEWREYRERINFPVNTGTFPPRPTLDIAGPTLPQARFGDPRFSFREQHFEVPTAPSPWRQNSTWNSNLKMRNERFLTNRRSEYQSGTQGRGFGPGRSGVLRRGCGRTRM